jgi:hypothetical protein
MGSCWQGAVKLSEWPPFLSVFLSGSCDTSEMKLSFEGLPVICRGVSNRLQSFIQLDLLTFR